MVDIMLLTGHVNWPKTKSSQAILTKKNGIATASLIHSKTPDNLSSTTTLSYNEQNPPCHLTKVAHRVPI